MTRLAPLRYLVLALLLAASVNAAPANPAPEAKRAAAAQARTATVFNRPVVTFRADFLGTSPAERAQAAEARIVQILEKGGPGTVDVDAIPQGVVVKIDGGFAFALTPADANTLAGETLEMTAGTAATALRQIIEETRESRDLRALGTAVLKGGIATVILAVLVWALALLRRVVARVILRVTQEKAGRLRIGGAELVSSGRVVVWVRRALALAFWALLLLIAYEWLGFVLSSFPYTRPWGERLTLFLLETATSIASGIAGALPDLFTAVVIFAIAKAIADGIGGFFDRVESGQARVDWIDAEMARPTRRLVSVAVWIFALVMAYPYLPGADTDAFKGISVLIGLMVSLGGASVVGQAASGLILMYTRTIRPGEYVRVGDHEGTVVDLGLYVTRMRTGLGEELTLPNSLVLGSVIRNYSRAVKGHGFVLDTVVTIGYDTPWRQVNAMLAEAARRTAGVLADPPPRVFQTALTDFYPEYRLICQAVPTEPRPRAEVLTALHQNIQDVFNEYGVQIMSPHYLGDPAEAKVVPPAKWRPPPAAPEDGSVGRTG
jgi:small-conductance mechanosensitive channel